MEKLQTLLWILFGLGVFIWRMVQKAKATTQRERQERKFSRPDSTGRPRPVAPLPATSFEEMLKQMQQQNRAGNAPETTPAGRALPQETAPVPRNLEQPIVTAKSLEREKQARSLEVPVPEARRAAGLPRAATQHGQEDYWSRVQRQQREEASRQALSGIQERLRNPADLRAAFVLSEILQRKF
ncbi:hypothetical protein J0X19_07845 [Hymenobacter sp. BT186]|uniref:Uncharacterized protein n=1 Tax=Hymenobacter telluris TaxID=2816474 RepID=A0A939EUN9_9BACT|nr:hypothetical protein [Hymenobacter telluris]MBO0357855.1 hypothetical protein [Hymenobacter telluris]MBW3373882.1 hypothetical protein [Hymenobacter norwichensis]